MSAAVSETMSQVAPYPDALAELVGRVSYRPGWPNSRCAAGRLKTAIDPPAILAAPPYPVIPLMVNGSAWPPMATSMWSPTAK